MDKHERVARLLAVEVDGHGFYAEPEAEDQIAAILRREYGSERVAALEEAAQIVERGFASCPCCDTMTLPHLDECTFATVWPDSEDEWRKWPECAAAIRALKEAKP